MAFSGWGGKAFLPYAARLAAEGLSGRAAMSVLRDAGFRFTTQVFYDEYRTLVGYEKGQWRAQRQPEDRLPPEDLLQPSKSYIGHPYTYVFSVVETDPETKEVKTGYRSIGLDRLVSIEEARGYLEDMVEASEDASAGVMEIGAFTGGYTAYYG